MPTGLAQIGINAASSAIGAGMGLLLEKHEDKRQIEQQQKLQDMQIAGQKQMSDYQYAQQLKMWHDTNYSAQMSELEKAGLNPGLLYGMSGGGGTTTGTPSGNITGAEAPKGGGEIAAQQGMALQLGMQQAQIALINAQTKNVEADTANKPKTGENIEASTMSLTAGVENTMAQTRLKNLEGDMAEVAKEIQGATKEEQIMKITMEASNARTTVDRLENQLKIEKATAENVIKTAYAQLLGIIAEKQLAEAQKGLVGEQAKNAAAERRNIQNKITQWAADNYTDLLNANTNERHAKVAEALKDYKYDNQGVEIISQAADGIFKPRIITKK